MKLTLRNGAFCGVLYNSMSLVMMWGDSETRVDGVRRRLDAIDASSPRRRSITPDAHRESAIQRGLKKRLEQLADERERRQRAAEKADEEFSLEFLNARPRRPNPLRNRLRRTAAPRRQRCNTPTRPNPSRTSAEARCRPWRH